MQEIYFRFILVRRNFPLDKFPGNPILCICLTITHSEEEKNMKRQVSSWAGAYETFIGEEEGKAMYRVFTRTWWRENPEWPEGLEPCPGRQTTIVRNVKSEEEARRICRQYNATHKPGRLSRKAEYMEQ
jgi:hypothetical protein